jgi:hypothetical protein
MTETCPGIHPARAVLTRLVPDLNHRGTKATERRIFFLKKNLSSDLCVLCVSVVQEDRRLKNCGTSPSTIACVVVLVACGKGGTKDDTKYWTCHAELGVPAKGLAAAFEKVCAEVSE